MILISSMRSERYTVPSTVFRATFNDHDYWQDLVQKDGYFQVD